MNADISFLDILNTQFERRVAANRRYSLRAFARDMGVSTSLLSSLLNQKKGLSEKSALTICKNLGLSKVQTTVFMLSVKMTHSRSPQKRAQAQSEFQRLLTKKESKALLDDQTLNTIANWVHLTILELSDLPQCTHEVKWFAKMLGISEAVTGKAIKSLLDSGQLIFTNGRYLQSMNETSTEMDKPNPALKRFHSEIIDRAKQSLTDDPPEKREFIGITLAFDSSDLQEAKEMIRTFQEEFCERFYRSAKNRNSVYQLSTQLFPLTIIK
jgi:uncharacterized protein (TIGR02147 family)